jgi:hypothetical protein
MSIPPDDRAVVTPIGAARATLNFSAVAANFPVGITTQRLDFTLVLQMTDPSVTRNQSGIELDEIQQISDVQF